MKRLRLSTRWSLAMGLMVGLLSLIVTVQLAAAAPSRQEGGEGAEDGVIEEHQTEQECQDCHLDVKSHWENSPHAHAFDDPYFQEQWTGLGEPDECLACHRRVRRRGNSLRSVSRRSNRRASAGSGLH